MTTPDITVVIPCFDSGEFLSEAIESVECYQGKYNYELIIVDDGSTDEKTLQLLSQLSLKGYNILYQENKGPAGARNTGVRHSQSEYVLFLDSDNKIRSEYINAGIKVLKNDPKVGVVYGNASFFGNVTRNTFRPKAFDINLIFLGNYIDMCSVIRRKVWIETGGLDEDRRLIGHEDWDFWIRVYKVGWQYHYIDQTLFDYRLREGSLISNISEDKVKKVFEHIYGKHAELLKECFQKSLRENNIHRFDMKRPFRSFIKYLNIKYLQKGTQFSIQ